VTVEYLDLAAYVAISAAVTGLDTETVMKVANLDLADSALHAPAAGFGDEDFYPDLFFYGRAARHSPVLEPPAPRRPQAGGVGGPAYLRRHQRLDLAPKADCR
jgi:hypothetical protein